MKILSDINVFGKKVFVRADLDVPLEQLTVDSSSSDAEALAGRQFTEAARLQNLKLTIDWLLDHGAKQIIIAGHLDRPKKPDPALSTKQLLGLLEKILGQKITFSSQFTVNSSQLENTVNREPITNNRIVLLENLRFWSKEEANDGEFARELASMADIYVNEAFGNSHRPHASMVTLPSLLVHAAGLHLTKEVEVLSNLLKNPARPFVAIVGGAKIETKLPVIENLAKFADFVLVGGAIAKELASSGQRLASSKVMIATLVDNTKDIDQGSIDKFGDIIKTAKTIVWNGPMGLFEEGFDRGSIAIAQAIVGSGAYSVVGGGETTAFLASKNLLSKFSFVSSGGGAMLEFLAGKKLPGIEALS